MNKSSHLSLRVHRAHLYFSHSRDSAVSLPVHLCFASIFLHLLPLGCHLTSQRLFLTGGRLIYQFDCRPWRTAVFAFTTGPNSVETETCQNTLLCLNILLMHCILCFPLYTAAAHWRLIRCSFYGADGELIPLWSSPLRSSTDRPRLWTVKWLMGEMKVNVGHRR